MKKIVCALLAFLFPPLGVILCGASTSHVLINIILTLFMLWIPGLIHALFVILSQPDE